MLFVDNFARAECFFRLLFHTDESSESFAIGSRLSPRPSILVLYARGLRKSQLCSSKCMFHRCFHGLVVTFQAIYVRWNFARFIGFTHVHSPHDFTVQSNQKKLTFT